MPKLSLKRTLVSTCLFVVSFTLFYELQKLASDTQRIKRHRTLQIQQKQVKFERILKTWCDVRNISLQNECLQHLKQFDDDCQRNKDMNSQVLDSSFEPDMSRPIEFHTFWQIRNNDLNQAFYERVLRLSLMSFLGTQEAPNRARLTLWVLNTFPGSIAAKIRKTFDGYIRAGSIRVRTFDLADLCSESIRKRSRFGQSGVCLTKHNLKFQPYELVGFSDFVRFFVLDLYGGIYFDGDVLLLKDMSPPAAYNFAYRWSYTQNFNTAVMSINQALVTHTDVLYSRLLSNPSNINLDFLIASLHPMTLSKSLAASDIFNYEPLRMLHSALFDPAWLCLDGYLNRTHARAVCSPTDLTNKRLAEPHEFRSPQHVFPGAFAYHLHLTMRDFTIVDGSYFRYFEDYYIKLLNLDTKSDAFE